MKLLIDARTVRPGRSGVGYFAESILAAIGAVCANHEIHALVLNQSGVRKQLDNSFLSNADAATIRFHEIGHDYESHPGNEIWENWGLIQFLEDYGFDAFWGAGLRIPLLKTNCRRALMVHDAAVFSHPECFPRAFATYMRSYLTRAVRAADYLTCSSETAADSIKTHIAEAQDKSIAVIPGAVDSFFSPGEPSSLPTGTRLPYVLALGAGDPRKNVDRLIAAFERARATAKLPHQLVLIGDPLAVRQTDHIVVHPRLNREELRSVYRAADLFVYPSLYEGFGLPVLEAMACGCPVAASTAGAIPEVAGNAVHYFSPLSTDEMANVIAEVLSAPEALLDMKNKGLSRVDHFSWRTSASKLITALEQMVASQHEA